MNRPARMPSARGDIVDLADRSPARAPDRSRSRHPDGDGPGTAHPDRAAVITEPLSVWIFGDLPLDTACGPSYMVESWTRELRRRGVWTRLFTPSGHWWRRSRTDSSVTFRTMRHIGFNGDHHARFSSLAELWRARNELPDVILVTTPGRIGALGVTLAARYDVPLVLVVSTEIPGAMVHFNAVRMVASSGAKPFVLLAAAPRVRAGLRARPQPADAPLRKRTKLVTRCADALQVQAKEVVMLSTKSRRSQTPGFQGPPIVVIPAGIDRLPKAARPAELRWRPGALRVLCVGRLSPEKSLSLLVEALRLAVDRGVDAHLALVGEGRLAGELVARAAGLGVADRFNVLGPYKRSRLRGVYASADVFAFASVVETQAFVLNEAAHEGLPLLVSDPEVNPVVADGQSALVVAHQPEAYAEGMRLLQDPGLRARLGAGARRRAQDVCESTQTARLEEVLRRAARADHRLNPVTTRSAP